jgi:hypothetical protein
MKNFCSRTDLFVVRNGTPPRRVSSCASTHGQGFHRSERQSCPEEPVRIPFPVSVLPETGYT